MTKLILTEENSILEILEFKKVGIIQIKEELKKNVEFSKNLTITDFEDLKQFEVIKSTKNGYVKTRNTIKRAFKSKRDEYNELAKQNIEAEREVIAVIEEEEKRLDELVEKAEKMKLRKQNESKLNERIESLKKYDFMEKNEVLLEMTEKEFGILLQSKRELFLQIQEQKIKEENERIQREKQARLEAEQEAQRQIELERKQKEELERKQKEELERVEREKQEAIDKIKREQEEKELAEKKRKEDLILKNQIDNERLKQETEYKKFISDNEGKFDKILKEDGKVVLYKKVAEFIIPNK